MEESVVLLGSLIVLLILWIIIILRIAVPIGYIIIYLYYMVEGIK